MAEMKSEVLRTPTQRITREQARERNSGTGGLRLKLAVAGEVPGHHLFWANDQDNEIETLLYEGFEFVLPSEVRMGSWIVEDKDIAGKISKYVGTKEDGTPLRAYLLKCPDDIWEDRQANAQNQADEWDRGILAGTVGGVDGRYNPKGTSRSIKNSAKG